MDPKWIGPALGVLLAAAWAGRDPQAPPESRPRAEGLMPSVEEREAPTSASRGNTSTDRDALLRRTEDSLGLSSEEADSFRSAALTAIEDVERAWAVREESWAAVSSSAASDPELLERLEVEIQSRYESEKARALQPLAARLGGLLEEWFDALR
jgi:hypothetical protein